MAAQKTVWISYDLGLKGDYAGMYAWLDSLQARECGDSLAVVRRKFTGEVSEEIKIELNKHVKLSATDRVYLIFRDDESGFVKGKFLNGGRKRAPWEGFVASIHEGGEDF